VTEKATDRYITFKGINGDANAGLVLNLLRSYIDCQEYSNAFWERFKDKLAQTNVTETSNIGRMDKLLLVHCYLNDIREFFEQHDDQAALTLLQKVEEESC
jgi:N(2)-fixation sustaining protein CowN